MFMIYFEMEMFALLDVYKQIPNDLLLQKLKNTTIYS